MGVSNLFSRTLRRRTTRSSADVRAFFSSLGAVNIETINVCDYAHLHPECPVSERIKKFGKQKLPIETIDRVLEEMEGLGFAGRVSFHHYSEPLLDDRIKDLVVLATRKAPSSHVNIWTNGSRLTYEFGLELLESGVHWIRISAYSQEEYDRLLELNGRLKARYPDRVLEVVPMQLDDRINIYEGPVLNIKKPCFDMSRVFIITARGDIQMCCMDFRNEHRFGNVNRESLKTILAKSDYLDMWNALKKGRRAKFDLCSRCRWGDHHLAITKADLPTREMPPTGGCRISSDG